MDFSLSETQTELVGLTRQILGDRMTLTHLKEVERSEEGFDRATWLELAKANLLGIVVVYLTLTIPTVILIEAFLSFLGLGAQAPLTSLGVMIAEGAAQLRSAPVSRTTMNWEPEFATEVAMF